MKLAIFICSLLLVQAFSAEVAPRSTKDEIKKLYDKLMSAIDSAITAAQDTVNKAFETVKTAATNLETSAKSSIQGALDALQGQMDALNAKAAAAARDAKLSNEAKAELDNASSKSIDLTPCQSYETAFDQIPDTLMDELIACVNNKIAEAQGIVDDAINNIKKVEEDYKDIESDIDNCGSGLKAIKCYAKLAEQIEKDTSEAPKKVAEDVAKATEYCATLESSLEECALGKVEKVGELAAEDMAQFALCAGINA